MPAYITVCDRCLTPIDSEEQRIKLDGKHQASGWITNKYGQNVHYCADLGSFDYDAAEKEEGLYGQRLGGPVEMLLSEWKTALELKKKNMIYYQ